jgi:hypothetical protein
VEPEQELLKCWRYSQTFDVTGIPIERDPDFYSNLMRGLMDTQTEADTPGMAPGIRYTVTTDELKALFVQKRDACFAVAAEHSKDGKDDMCNHGIVMQYEAMGRDYDVRASHLQENMVFTIDGTLLTELFTPVPQPAKASSAIASSMDVSGLRPRSNY